MYCIYRNGIDMHALSRDLTIAKAHFTAYVNNDFIWNDKDCKLNRSKIHMFIVLIQIISVFTCIECCILPLTSMTVTAVYNWSPWSAHKFFLYQWSQISRTDICTRKRGKASRAPISGGKTDYILLHFEWLEWIATTLNDLFWFGNSHKMMF